MDPDLRGCARKGHETYRPTGPGEERLADRLHVSTPAGEAWRCLRCGTFAVGEPRTSGPAEDAPRVLRGKALRDARILRLLAAERFIRGALLCLAGYALLRFEGSQGSIQQLFDKAVPAAKPGKSAKSSAKSDVKPDAKKEAKADPKPSAKAETKLEAKEASPAQAKADLLTPLTVKASAELAAEPASPPTAKHSKTA